MTPKVPESIEGALRILVEDTEGCLGWEGQRRKPALWAGRDESKVILEGTVSLGEGERPQAAWKARTAGTLSDAQQSTVRPPPLKSDWPSQGTRSWLIARTQGPWMLGAGALGRPRGMEWGGRREEGSGWGTHVYLWRIHFDIWQN